MTYSDVTERSATAPAPAPTRGRGMSRKKTAAIGVLAVAGIGGGVAYAYPPGTAMTVAATSSASTPGGSSPVVVTVNNVNPTCSTQVTIDGANTVTLPPGTTTYTYSSVSLGSGRHRVNARSVSCASGKKEHAHSNFVVLDAQVAGAPTAPIKTNYPVTYSGLEPGSTVTAIATLTGPGTQLGPETDTVDKRGDAKVKFKFKTAGTWVIASMVNGTPLSSVTVTVS